MNERPVRKDNRLEGYDYSRAGDYFVTVDKYVIMPNHVHLIIALAAGDRGRSPLQQIVRNIQSYVTQWAGFSPWQKSFHDHIIRNEADYLRIWQYIDDNPARWTEDCYFVSE